MKNSIVFIGITLVSLVNVCNASNVVDKKRVLNPTVYEAIDSVKTNKIGKTTGQLMAEDNAITGNNISNETQVMDFAFINSNSIVEEIIESVNADKMEKKHRGTYCPRQCNYRKQYFK